MKSLMSTPRFCAHPEFGLPPEVVQQWCELVRARTICLENPPAVEYKRDPEDAPFLAAAIATAADYLITGDKDLIAAQSLIDTKIVTAAEFAGLFLVAG